MSQQHTACCKSVMLSSRATSAAYHLQPCMVSKGRRRAASAETAPPRRAAISRRRRHHATKQGMQLFLTNTVPDAVLLSGGTQRPMRSLLVAYSD